MHFFFSLCHALIYKLDKNSKKDFTVDLIAGQITQGSVLAQDGHNCKYAIIIESESEQRVYWHNPEILQNEITYFSFVNTEATRLKFHLEAYVADEKENFLPGNIKLSFNSKFNTFDKELAKKHAVEPAMKQLIEFEKLLHQTLLKTENKRSKLLGIIKSQRDLFSSVYYLSLFLFVVFLGINIMQMKQAENFFKQKKLI